jgi:hypothetical protein
MRLFRILKTTGKAENLAVFFPDADRSAKFAERRKIVGEE